jgi:hypothetical protein
MGTVLMVLGGLVGLVVGYFIGRIFASPRRERYVRVQPPPLDGMPPPGESARNAAASVREFGALVERLAARDVDVSGLTCVPGTRWELVVERGADADRHRKSENGRWATRVSWHAGDEDLRVEKSIRLPNVVPNRWNDEPGRPIGPDGDAIAAAETFIIERFAKGAGPER